MGVDPGKLSCYAAGVLLGIGWWIIADGAASAAYHNSHISFDIVKYLPGIVATLAFFLCVVATLSQDFYNWRLVCSVVLTAFYCQMIQDKHGQLGHAVGRCSLYLWLGSSHSSSVCEVYQ